MENGTLVEARVDLGVDQGQVQIAGQTIAVHGVGDKLRAAVLHEVTAWATQHGQAVHVVAAGPDPSDGAEFVVDASGVLHLVEQQGMGAAEAPAPPVPAPATAPPPRRAYDFGDDEPLPAAQLAGELGAPLVVLVANTKGESGKTPLAVLLAQAFGSFRPGDVAVLDLDPTGNLAARAGTGRSTPSLPQLVTGSANAGQWSDVTRLLAWHHDSRIWVVSARDPEASSEAGQMPRGGLTAAVQALAKGVRVIILDAGNDERDPVFQEAVGLATQLVVPVRWDVPTVRDGAGVLLRSLYALGHQDLATRAVIVGTYPLLRRPARRDEARFRAEFERMGHRIVDVPSDGHIDQRAGIIWSRLRSRTRTAALALAELVAPPGGAS